MMWIYDYPSWEIAILFSGVLVLLTWGGTFALRRTVHGWFHRGSGVNEMVGLALSSFYVLYGLLLGLLAVATYQNLSTLSDTVDREASSIAALYRDFGGYPVAVRDTLRDDLREYARYTIQDAWPLQRRGIIPPEGAARIAQVYDHLLSFEPAKENEKIIFAETLREFNRFIEVRRTRLASVDMGLPAVLWWVVAFGAIMSVALIWLLKMEIYVHLILGAILASILGAIIFLIAEQDNPFRGEVAIGPDAIELIYTTVMKSESAAAPKAAGPSKS